MPKHRRNASPPPLPPRRPGQPSPQRVATSLARVRQIAGSVNERERPFEPSRRGSWKGSSRDLVVNGHPRLASGYAYELQPGEWADWQDSDQEDWDTVILSAGDIRGAKWVGSKRIDGVRCAVFHEPRKNTFYAQTETYARNGKVDPRDIPAHLHGAELRNEPEFNGQDVGFSQGIRSRSADWFQVGYATGSDYSGGSVSQSNYEVLAELLEEQHSEGEEPVVWARTSGGHGTYGIAVRYGDLSEESREAIDALEDYPLMSEEHHSELEMKLQDEAWDDWARGDFIKAVAKNNNKEWLALEDAISKEDWRAVFHAATESANIYWEDQEGAGAWIDVERAADKLEKFINTGGFPKHSSDYEDDALQRLYDALPGVEDE